MTQPQDMMNEIINELEPETDCNTHVWTCRVIFYDILADAYTSKLVPWLTYDHDKALDKKAEIAHNMISNRLLMYVKYDHAYLRPFAVRVAELAEIPF